jgi:hypothetical protein
MLARLGRQIGGGGGDCLNAGLLIVGEASPISQARTASGKSGGRPERGKSWIAWSGPTAATRRAQRVTRWRSMPSAAGVSPAFRRSAKCRMIADRSTWASMVSVECASSLRDSAITLALRGISSFHHCNQPCGWLTQSPRRCQHGAKCESLSIRCKASVSETRSKRQNHSPVCRW